ncbi:protein FAM167A-like [Babylonia areolata]|uniref:protein FAM167A-like n=1 Tax=Babylonia areolata TaxID=304850 RepID=UPI003FD55DA0
MTLEDRQAGVMGGRKDDVTRTPKQQTRKRPLSAVLEEFEVEDCDLRDNLNSLNNQTGVIPEAKDEARRVSTSPDTAGHDGESTLRSRAETRTATSAKVSVSSLKTLFETDRSSAHSGHTSPKVPRKHGSRLGGRPPLSPTLSPRIARRGSHTSPGDVIDSDGEKSPTSDMTRLRQMADRLCLSTRRPSLQQWRARYVDSRPEVPVLWNCGNGDVDGHHGDEGGGEGKWTEERTEKINTALDWIKTELQEMRTQDQQLARQLLSIRSDLHRLKLARSCEEHQDLLDDVQCELEELQEFADVLDLPTPTLTLTDSPLKHLGVTRMNFSARRFSTC